MTWMGAKTDLRNAKCCLEETVQETKQRMAFYSWTKPSEEDSKVIKAAHIAAPVRLCRTKSARHDPRHVCKITECLGRGPWNPCPGPEVTLKAQNLTNERKIKSLPASLS